MTYKFIDLFCGIGSFHYSFDKMGWKCVLASDIDETVHDVYEKNHGMKPVGDIYDINPDDIPHYDVLCAGFPCQPFSNAGKHGGFDDERGILFLEIIRLMKAAKPKVAVLENVSALKSHDKGKTFKIICEKIEEQGYTVHHKVLKCSDYGLPQMRKRIFMVCVRNDITHDVDIFDLKEYEKDVTMKEYLGKNFEKKHAYTIRCGGARSPITSKQNWDGYMVDGEVYRLTIQDAKKLQGFDDDFYLSEDKKDKKNTWRYLGNTIPTKFTELMGLKVKSILDRHEQSSRRVET
jgi:DNA (cytosine-5)-methyltransferase 1